MQKEFIDQTNKLISFISQCPTSFHTVEALGKMLLKGGFKELSEDKPFNLKKGQCYFVKRNLSSIIAFRIPEKTISAYRIISSHSDFPCFKVKHNPEIDNGGLYTTLNVEPYGGMLVAPWFDRPLSIAGKAYVDGKASLVDFGKPVCIVPNLCIHHNRDANNGHKYDIQKEVRPLISDGKKGCLAKLLADSLKCKEEEIEETELYLYNPEEGKIWGEDQQFFSSPRIDNLMCAYSSMESLVASKETDKIQIAAVFDNEEVGSLSKQGADSDFLEKTLLRIADNLKISFEDQCLLQSKSLILSADNAHSFHPNYPEVCDITNRPVMNGGIVIKYSANMKYTTDSTSAQAIMSIFKNAKVPYQIYHSNSDIPGGSTLGNISQSHISMPTADIGAAQLAMHSPYETAGVKDCSYLIDGMTAFLNN